MREYIRTANVNKLVEIMTEGNDTVRDLLDECIKRLDDWSFIQFVLTLDDMNIRGDQIEFAYKEYYQADFDKFVAGIKEREQNLIGSLNSTYLATVPDAAEKLNQKACKSGAERSNGFYLPDNINGLIRIIDSESNVLFELHNNDWLVVEDYSKTHKRESQFEYLDDYHFRCDGTIYHCWEFAQAITVNHYHLYPSNRKYVISGRTLVRNNKNVKRIQKKKGA